MSKNDKAFVWFLTVGLGLLIIGVGPVAWPAFWCAQATFLIAVFFAIRGNRND